MVTLELDRVGAAYGRLRVLRDISTPAFAGGEVVALLGPNASGKSTLFRRVAGVLPGPGTIRVGGARTPAPICWMPQDTGSSPVLTVFEAVLLARMQGRGLRVGAEDRARVEETLDAFAIADLAARTVGDLSGGQRQLVGAAQALVRDPEILLMDEPTSALDLQRQVELLGIVRDLARTRGLLVVVALHDLNHALRFADRALVIRDGGLVACGPTPDVVTPDLLRRVYGVAARVEPCSRGLLQVIVDGAAAPRDTSTTLGPRPIA